MNSYKFVVESEVREAAPMFAMVKIFVDVELTKTHRKKDLLTSFQCPVRYAEDLKKRLEMGR